MSLRTRITWAISLGAIFLVYAIALSIFVVNDKVERIEQLEQEVQTKSDIEIIESRIILHINVATENIRAIEDAKEFIKNTERVYEFNTLSRYCYEAQADRKFNGLEYNIEYCKDEVNLDQFRKK